ncbi:uncharacterized protein LOC121996733 [Zingiber officinale]|uniref:O-fucosyltransferase family protein n=1 Tax=Zingiber officinale TaxID=94328 RepID=A0A8J5L0J6_ZINOF|nr:uncharacterized protein LOC121996733 [Zingiber officinale]KAG6500097.1 hypothetical protein ZIOFF_039911 [Zingiber officinale]
MTVARALSRTISGDLRIGGGRGGVGFCGRNFCFAAFILAVVILTVLVSIYQPADPLLRPPAAASQLTSFLASTSNATFLPDGSVLRTGEDFLNSSSSAAAPFIGISDVNSSSSNGAAVVPACDPAAPIDCGDPELFHLLMRAAIEALPDLHFYRFGKPVAVAGDPGSCDIDWRFRPKDAVQPMLYKDFRRFHLSRSPNCAVSVSKIEAFHSGVGARKKADEAANATEFVVGEPLEDSLPAVISEAAFAAGRYLVYAGGGDRCKSMNHYLWSFLCALGEAQFLNRTLVMNMDLCLSSMYTGRGQDEEGKDFRFYFDFERLKKSASVIEQGHFWTEWGKRHKLDGLKLYYVDDFKVTPMSLVGINDSLIMRQFSEVEPDNYWYRVCEGKTESAIQRPWHLLWKSRRLMDIVSAITSRMNWDFDSVHLVRGEKAKNTEIWPNLAADTSLEKLLVTLKDKVEEGRQLYIATREPDTSSFEPLKEAYSTYFLDDFKDLWDENSEWYLESKELNNGVPVEFDGYMRIEVDTEVFLRGEKQLETFNDLTSDCRHGVHTC